MDLTPQQREVLIFSCQSRDKWCHRLAKMKIAQYLRAGDRARSFNQTRQSASMGDEYLPAVRRDNPLIWGSGFN